MKRLPRWFTWVRNHIWWSHQTDIPDNWQEHLISLYIIRKIDGICLFSHHFQLGLSQIENQLVGMGFTALVRMLHEIVDPTISLNMIDCGHKKILIDERRNLLAVLVTTQNSHFLREKLKELIDHFEKLFELQQRINLTTHVCLEDYALTTELVSLVFKDQPARVLDMIPLIFKSIQKRNSIISEREHSLNVT